MFKIRREGKSVCAVQALGNGIEISWKIIHIRALHISRRPVIEDGVAKDVVGSIFGFDVHTAFADDDCDLQFKIQRLSVVRIGDFVVWPKDTIRIGVVENGELIPFLGNITSAVLAGGSDVLLEGVGVSQGGRFERAKGISLHRRQRIF